MSDEYDKCFVWDDYCNVIYVGKIIIKMQNIFPNLFSTRYISTWILKYFELQFHYDKYQKQQNWGDISPLIILYRILAAHVCIQLEWVIYLNYGVLISNQSN